MPRWSGLYPTIYRYPYMIELAGAKPAGYQEGAPNPSSSGQKWSNGGGWIASDARVAAGAYVGPHAAVLSGTVGAGARIEDHAVIAGGTVNGGEVGGQTIVLPGVTVTDNAQVLLGWPYGPAFFERPQTIGGSARMLGDLEFRGASASRTSGT